MHLKKASEMPNDTSVCSFFVRIFVSGYGIADRPINLFGTLLGFCDGIFGIIKSIELIGVRITRYKEKNYEANFLFHDCVFLFCDTKNINGN